MHGSELRELRDQRGVKAAWLAERMGLRHRQQISKIESKKDVSVDEFVAYVSALDLKPGDLLENSAGNIAPYLPILEQLRRVHPDALDRIQEVIKNAVLCWEDGFRHGSTGVENESRSRGTYTAASGATDEPVLPLHWTIGSTTPVAGATDAHRRGHTAAKKGSADR